MLETIAYGAEIAAAAARKHLDPRLLAAVAAQESGGPGSNSGSNVVGDGGHGHGVFQIDDRWHSFASTPAAADPAQNADFAAGLLSDLLSRYHGDVHAALSAYNSGSPAASGTQTTWQDGAVLGYADSVMRHLSSIAAVPGAGTHPAASGAPAAGALPGSAQSTGPPPAAPSATGAVSVSSASVAPASGGLAGIFTPQLPSAGNLGMPAAPDLRDRHEPDHSNDQSTGENS